jgi:hypothetical protein
MRTTLDIDEDVLLAAKALARRRRQTAGAVISELARKGLTHADGASTATVSDQAGFYGFEPLPAHGRPVTDELIDSLREELGD